MFVCVCEGVEGGVCGCGCVRGLCVGWRVVWVWDVCGCEGVVCGMEGGVCV